MVSALLLTFFIFHIAFIYLEKYKPNHKLMKLHKKLHWVYQVMPPVLLAFLFTKNGPGLWFLMSIVFISGGISIISILIKLFKLHKNKEFLLRPALTIIIASVFFILAENSVTEAKAQTIEIAKNIEKICKQNKECPASIKSWKEVEIDKTYSSKVGNFITYPVIYRNLGDHFTLYIYQSLDWGTEYSAGVDTALQIKNHM